jgi:hypothetical protein
MGNKKVVVKRFPIKYQEKVDREKEGYRHLESPRILRYYGCKKDQDHLTFVFEKADCTLFDLIDAFKAEDDSVWHRNASRREFLKDVRLKVTLWDEKIDRTPPQVPSQSQSTPSYVPSQTLLALIK